MINVSIYKYEYFNPSVTIENPDSMMLTEITGDCIVELEESDWGDSILMFIIDGYIVGFGLEAMQVESDLPFGIDANKSKNILIEYMNALLTYLINKDLIKDIDGFKDIVYDPTDLDTWNPIMDRLIPSTYYSGDDEDEGGGGGGIIKAASSPTNSMPEAMIDALKTVASNASKLSRSSDALRLHFRQFNLNFDDPDGSGLETPDSWPEGSLAHLIRADQLIPGGGEPAGGGPDAR